MNHAQKPPSVKEASPTAGVRLPLVSIHTFDSLSVPAFRIFFIAAAMNSIALQMQLMSRNWYIYELTGDRLMIGYIGMATGLSMIPFAFVGGALADRMEKRTLLLIGATGQAVATLAIGLMIFAGLANWWNLILLTVGFSMSTGITMPTRNAIIPALVGRDRFLNAISLNAAEMNLTTIIAPSVGGYLIAWAGIGWVYLLMGVLAFLSGVVLLFMKPVGVTPRQGARTSVGTDLKEGLKYLKDQPLLLYLVVFAIVIVLLGMPFQFMLPVFTKDVLDVGPAKLGILLSAMGIGALIGSLSLASLSNLPRKGFLLIALTVLFGAGIIAFSFSQILLISILIMVPIGIGQTARNTLNTTMVQQHTDPRMLGRVMSIFMMTIGFHSIGIFPISILANWLGPEAAFAIAGILIVVFALGMGLLRPEIRRIP